MKISAIQKELQEKLKNHLIKWENPEKFHLTLRFLGSTDKRIIDEIIGDLSLVSWDFSSIDFNSSQIGFFPNFRKPNVIYIGLDESGIGTDKLIAEIDKAIVSKGIIPDKKFVAHITMGRFRRENRMKVPPDFVFEFEPFPVSCSSFFMMKSEMDSKGSKYYTVKEIKFKN
jgi:2'-5' RNA ligase